MKTLVIATTCYFDYLALAEKIGKKLGYQVLNLNDNKELSLWDASIALAKKVIENQNNFGIIIEDYGCGSFMITSKFKSTIVAQVADEHSAHMTKEHNNTNIISIGAEITGLGLFGAIVERFLTADFAGGRHLVRTDMLKTMLAKETE